MLRLIKALTKYRKSDTPKQKEVAKIKIVARVGKKKREKKLELSIITKECFFLELRSNVVWYSISTKFFRHGTLTSFFTA